MIRSLLLAAGLVAGPLGAAAQDLAVTGAYILSSNPRTGAAFMTITNPGPSEVRILAARSPAARTVELHASTLADGIARMRPVEGGIAVPAGGSIALERGGLHLMMMGLTAPLAPGDRVPLTLVTDGGGDIVLDITVGTDGAPADPAAGAHGGHHGATQP